MDVTAAQSALQRVDLYGDDSEGDDSSGDEIGGGAFRTMCLDGGRCLVKG